MAADNRLPDDPTPISGAPTDVARLSHGEPKPPHERTAEDEAQLADWERIARSAEFKELLQAKRRFIVPATIFFVLYYFALPYLVGYHSAFMQRKVWGEMNLAYLFALSQFFIAWILAALYVTAAKRWDQRARRSSTALRDEYSCS
jgi:uncharacterized membrane protein (DUF485 family)